MEAELHRVASQLGIRLVSDSREAGPTLSRRSREESQTRWESTSVAHTALVRAMLSVGSTNSRCPADPIPYRLN